jgi:hypothetical protein
MAMSEADAETAIEQTFLGTDDLDYSNAPEELRGMLDQVDQEIHAWIPNPGDKVFGVVSDISESSEGDFGAYPIILIKTPSGKFVHVHCFHTILRREIDRRVSRGQLGVGDLIAIKYEGEGEASKGKQAARVYRVAIRRPTK